jgi:hypothetical protein
MRDVLLALAALAAFATFVGILIYEVPRLDLVIVVGIVFVMAAFDFARELFAKRR